MRNKNTLIIIVGTTAIGKTAKAIALAQLLQCEIISCDSRQFFKEMTIGTAVPSTEELQAAPHHFIQNKSITDTYNVGDFEREVMNLLPELFKENATQIMVGGSGLYVDAITKGFDTFPDIAPEVREQIKAQYAQNGLVYLQENLRQYDPKYYQYLQENNPQTLENPQRMMRFLEVSIASGNPYSSYLNQAKNERDFNCILIGLEAPREIIYDRINQRVDSMIAQGLVQEAQELYPYKQYNALQTVGYRELFDYFEGKCTLEQAIEQIKTNTRRFAKRQLTWFKRNDQITWFDYKTPAEDILAFIKKGV